MLLCFVVSGHPRMFESELRSGKHIYLFICMYIYEGHISFLSDFVFFPDLDNFSQLTIVSRSDLEGGQSEGGRNISCAALDLYKKQVREQSNSVNKT